MQTKNLLIEIGMAELPTAAVEELSQSFFDLMTNALLQSELSFDAAKRYATARRIALYIEGIQSIQPDQKVHKKGPSLKAAKDESGNWTKAVIGFANANGVTPDDLVIEATPKGDWLYYKEVKAGQKTAALLPDLFKSVIDQLVISKRMRWGSNTESFVRPVISLVMMLDESVIPCTLFGIKSSNQSIGHRFHGKRLVSIPKASDYESVLANSYVVADIDKRRDLIIEQSSHLMNMLQNEGVAANILISDETLAEVNALVEYPNALLGEFDPRYLELPQEVLIKTMQDNQKYFPVVDDDHRILPYFVTIANIESKDVKQVVVGNQRVIEPRFSDAEFFWKNDLKQPLIERKKELKQVVYQQKLGSVEDRVDRIINIAELIADEIGVDSALSKRAATLAKCDLVTEMVFEFGELQGIVGQYYAEKDGEDQEVATAIREHYLPKFSGDELPETQTGLIVALADKVESIIGGFSVGAKPTGTKDPYSIRRASLGVIRLLNETTLDLGLRSLFEKSALFFAKDLKSNDYVNDIIDYINERLKGYYQDLGIRHDIFEAVIAVSPNKITDISNRVEALTIFLNDPNAINLFAANKRITNLLKKAEKDNFVVNEKLFSTEAERSLFAAATKVAKQVETYSDQALYLDALKVLSSLREPLDQFFDQVMVMSKDIDERHNRLALLAFTREIFLKIADVSLIQVD